MADNKYADIGAVPVSENSPDYSDIGAVPVKDEKTGKQAVAPPDISAASAAGLAFEHGLPFSAGDYTDALARALGHRHGLPEGTKDIDPDTGKELSFNDRFQKMLQGVRKESEQAAEQHPGVYLPTELGTSLVTAPMLLSRLGSVFKASEGAGKAEKALKLARTGAAIGGSYGLGASTGNLVDNPSRVAADTVNSAALGALTTPILASNPRIAGAALGAGAALESHRPGYALPAAAIGALGAPLLASMPAVQDLKRTFNYEMAKKPVVGQAAAESLEPEINTAASNVVSDLISGKKNASKEVGNILSENAGNVSDIKPVLEEHLKQALSLPEFTDAQKSDKRSILTTLQNMLGGKTTEPLTSGINPAYEAGLPSSPAPGNLAPQDIKDRALAIRDLTNIGDNPVETAKGKGIVYSLQNALDNALNKALPEDQQTALTNAEEQVNKFGNAQEILGAAPNGPVTVPEKTKLDLKMGRMIRGLEGGGSTAQNKQSQVEAAADQLKDVAPDFASFLKENVGELADRYNLYQQSQAKPIGYHNLMGTAKGIAEQGAGYTGRYTGLAKDTASDAAKAASDFISNVTPERVKSLMPLVSEPYQRVLSTLIDAPEASRKAVMFSLMQQPAFRESVMGTVKNALLPSPKPKPSQNE